jgi:hypothetical protein
MNASPITTWEGAQAFFTFADRPALLVLLTLVAAAVCVYAVSSMIKHENSASKRITER